MPLITVRKYQRRIRANIKAALNFLERLNTYDVTYPPKAIFDSAGHAALVVIETQLEAALAAQVPR